VLHHGKPNLLKGHESRKKAEHNKHLNGHDLAGFRANDWLRFRNTVQVASRARLTCPCLFDILSFTCPSLAKRYPILALPSDLSSNPPTLPPPSTAD
jgi:hypothetical protein